MGWGVGPRRLKKPQKTAGVPKRGRRQGPLPPPMIGGLLPGPQGGGKKIRGGPGPPGGKGGGIGRRKGPPRPVLSKTIGPPETNTVGPPYREGLGAQVGVPFRGALGGGALKSGDSGDLSPSGGGKAGEGGRLGAWRRTLTSAKGGKAGGAPGRRATIPNFLGSAPRLIKPGPSLVGKRGARHALDRSPGDPPGRGGASEGVPPQGPPPLGGGRAPTSRAKRP